MKVGDRMKKHYDERETLFSRVRLEEGSSNSLDFYRKHPGYKTSDDAIRGMDFLDNLKKDTAFKSRFFPLFQQNETIIKQFYETLEAIPLADKQPIPEGFESNIKAIAGHYGACDAGIVRLKKTHYYSHRGFDERPPGESYGEKIEPRHKTAIVFLVRMDKDALMRAPHFEEIAESMNAYMNLAYTGMRLASYLKALGYDSTFQSEIHYLTPLVPLAVDGGLGEVGMTNHLVHPEYGNRVRIGAVMSDIDLQPDQPIDYGLELFCKRCALCLMNCPMQSISFKQRTLNGKRFYKLDEHSCFKLFKKAGTDCGVCIQSCPLSYEIDPKRLKAAKGNPEKIDTIIKDHLNKNGRRPKHQRPLPIVEE